MDFQQYLRNTIKGKTVILVGNAPFQRNCSDLVDSHDCVFRFNLFSRNGYADGLCGNKTTHWCNNLGRNPRSHREQRRHHCELVKQIQPIPVVLVASAEDKSGRLRTAKTWYPEQGLSLIYPDSHLTIPPSATTKEPSVGFYMAYRLLHEDIPIALIGFTGKVNPKHHDGEAEMAFLRAHPLATLMSEF